MCLICFFLMTSLLFFLFFFFNDTATTDIYTLSLHDALPISPGPLKKPDTPCSTISTNPPRAYPATGQPAIWASAQTIPNGSSQCTGSRVTDAPAINCHSLDRGCGGRTTAALRSSW